MRAEFASDGQRIKSSSHYTQPGRPLKANPSSSPILYMKFALGNTLAPNPETSGFGAPRATKCIRNKAAKPELAHREEGAPPRKATAPNPPKALC